MKKRKPRIQIRLSTFLLLSGLASLLLGLVIPNSLRQRAEREVVASLLNDAKRKPVYTSACFDSSQTLFETYLFSSSK
jgi:hypothetical protein